MNYQIVKVNNNFNVVETLTGLTIESFDVFNLARKYLSFLNKGGAFNGFTPAFILRKVHISINSDYEDM